MRKIFVSKWLIWLLGFIIIFPVVLPCFKERLFRVHDFTHVARLAELDRSLQGGDFPPRWSENLGFGYGIPLFSFYAPLPYMIGVGIAHLGLSYERAVQVLFFITFYFSFMAMYVLARQFFSNLGAIAAATLFVYSPYRAVDAYVRGALGELFGILFVVLCLLGISKLLFTKNKTWISLTALSIGGLMLSHNLMALIGLPIVCLWGLWWLVAERHKSNFYLMIGIALLLGLGLSSYFVVPALTEKSFTSVDELTKGEGNYEQHFVYLRQLVNSKFGYGGSIEGINDGISFEIGKIHIILIVMSLYGLITTKNRRSKQFYLALFSLMMVLGAIFLTNSRSAYLWQTIPLMKYFQFPWRFLSVILIFAPLLGGYVVEHLSHQRKYSSIALGSLLLIVIWYYTPLFRPEYYPEINNPIYSTDASYIQNEMSKVIPDYIHPQLASVVLSREKNIFPPKERFVIDSKNKVSLKIIDSQPEKFVLELSGQGLATISANIFDFPGWRWWVDGAPVDYDVGKDLPIMSVSVSLSQNKTVRVSGKLTETPIRMISNWISLISLALILYWIVLSHKTYANK